MALQAPANAVALQASANAVELQAPANAVALQAPTIARRLERLKRWRSTLTKSSPRKALPEPFLRRRLSRLCPGHGLKAPRAQAGRVYRCWGHLGAYCVGEFKPRAAQGGSQRARTTRRRRRKQALKFDTDQKKSSPSMRKELWNIKSYCPQMQARLHYTRTQFRDPFHLCCPETSGHAIESHNSY